MTLCHPDSVTNRRSRFLQLQTMADADFPHGRRYYTKSGYFASLNDKTVDRLLRSRGHDSCNGNHD